MLPAGRDEVRDGVGNYKLLTKVFDNTTPKPALHKPNLT